MNRFFLFLFLFLFSPYSIFSDETEWISQASTLLNKTITDTRHIDLLCKTIKPIKWTSQDEEQAQYEATLFEDRNGLLKLVIVFFSEGGRIDKVFYYKNNQLYYVLISTRMFLHNKDGSIDSSFRFAKNGKSECYVFVGGKLSVRRTTESAIDADVMNGFFEVTQQELIKESNFVMNARTK